MAPTFTNRLSRLAGLWPVVFFLDITFQISCFYWFCFSEWYHLGFLIPAFGSLVSIVVVCVMLSLSFLSAMMTDPGLIPHDRWKPPHPPNLLDDRAIYHNSISTKFSLSDPTNPLDSTQQASFTERSSLISDSSKAQRQLFKKMADESIPPYSMFSYCEICDEPKPLRAHHCSRCNVCVLRMDHHCFWLNNCVGFSNYKFFFHVICWATVGSFLSFVIFLSKILQIPLQGYSSNYYLLGFLGAAIFLDCAAICLLLWLLLLQIRLLKANLTYIEFICCGGNMWHCNYEKDSWIEHLQEVFGEEKRYWLVPFPLGCSTLDPLNACFFVPTPSYQNFIATLEVRETSLHESHDHQQREGEREGEGEGEDEQKSSKEFSDPRKFLDQR